MRPFPWLLVSLSLTFTAGAGEPFAVVTAPLDPADGVLKPPFVALVWKADCGPCLIELGYLDKLQQAAGGRIVSLSLDPPELAAETLAERAVPDHAAYVASGEAKAILATLSGGATRLPLSVAVDAHGEICARHVGLLGTQTAEDWSEACLK